MDGGDRAAGVALTPHESYEHYYLVIQAAACGLGVAIVPRLLVGSEINAGHLVAPLGFTPGPYSLDLRVAQHLRARADVQQLATWLRAEMQQ